MPYTFFLTHNRVPVTPKPGSDPHHALTTMSCDVFVHMQCYYASCIYIITHAHIFTHIIHASHLSLSMPVKISYSIYQHVIFHTACYQSKPYTAHINMSSSKLHVINQSHNTYLNWPELTCLIGQCPPQEHGCNFDSVGFP